MQKLKAAEYVRSAVELKLDVHPKEEVAGSLPLLILKWLLSQFSEPLE